MNRKQKWLHGLETLGVALTGAALFVVIHIPLPWLLGPLTAVIVWSLATKRPLYWPIGFRQVALVLLGYMLGTSFTRETAWGIVEQLPAMFAMVVLTIVFSLVMGYIVAKGARVSTATGIFGSVPGGLSQMVIMSEELDNVDETVVTFMQTVRIMAVIFAVPFLVLHGIADRVVARAGGERALTAVSQHSWFDLPWYHFVVYLLVIVFGIWLAHKVGLPAAYNLGPLFATAILLVATGLTPPPVPDISITVAQLLLGTHIGLQMKLSSLQNWKKLSVYAVATNLVLIGFSLVLAVGLTWLYPLTLSTAFLSTAPGGVVEMGITGNMVGADLAMITGYQLLRLFVVLLLVPPLLKWWVTRSGGGGRLMSRTKDTKQGVSS